MAAGWELVADDGSLRTLSAAVLHLAVLDVGRYPDALVFLEHSDTAELMMELLGLDPHAVRQRARKRLSPRRQTVCTQSGN